MTQPTKYYMLVRNNGSACQVRLEPFTDTSLSLYDDAFPNNAPHRFITALEMPDDANDPS